MQSCFLIPDSANPAYRQVSIVGKFFRYALCLLRYLSSVAEETT